MLALPLLGNVARQSMAYTKVCRVLRVALALLQGLEPLNHETKAYESTAMRANVELGLIILMTLS